MDVKQQHFNMESWNSERKTKLNQLSHSNPRLPVWKGLSRVHTLSSSSLIFPLALSRPKLASTTDGFCAGTPNGDRGPNDDLFTAFFLCDTNFELSAIGDMFLVPMYPGLTGLLETFIVIGTLAGIVEKTLSNMHWNS
jgi:hypothetical protein